MLPAAVLALTLLLLLFSKPVAAAFTQWTTTGRATTLRILSVVVLVALVLSIDPEARAFWAFLDATGVDIFLMLLFLQGRATVYWLNIPGHLGALLRILETWGRYPMPLPHRTLIKQHPGWSAYSAAQSICMAMLLAAPCYVLIQSARLLD
jgi:hypothetical protein